MDPEDEEEYFELQKEQATRKRESDADSLGSPLKYSLHQNHNMAINSTLLDKRPAVKMINLRTSKISSNLLYPASDSVMIEVLIV